MRTLEVTLNLWVLITSRLKEDCKGSSLDLPQDDANFHEFHEYRLTKCVVTLVTLSHFVVFVLYCTVLYPVLFFCTSCHSTIIFYWRVTTVESASHKPPALLSLLLSTGSVSRPGLGCRTRLTSQVWNGPPAGRGMRPICPFTQEIPGVKCSSAL